MYKAFTPGLGKASINGTSAFCVDYILQLLFSDSMTARLIYILLSPLDDEKAPIP